MPSPPRHHHRFAAVLLALYGVLFIATAFHVVDRQTWVLESAVSLTAVVLLVLSRNRLPLSRISYTLIFIHVVLHTIAAHYTYSQVPYDQWSQNLFGFSIDDALSFERNQFDRFVHLCYGLLIAYPVRELVLRIADVRGFWGYFLPLDITMSTSMMYELVEWGVAMQIGDGNPLYLGTQGDPWDAQKDMALATIGAVIAMIVTALVNVKYQRDFAREWLESLRVKHRVPLGEDAIARMKQDGTWREE